MLTLTFPGKVNCRTALPILPIGTWIIVGKVQRELLISGQIINTSHKACLDYLYGQSVIEIVEKKNDRRDREGEWEKKKREGGLGGLHQASVIWLIYYCVVWGCDTERKKTAVTKKKKRRKHGEREKASQPLSSPLSTMSTSPHKDTSNPLYKSIPMQPHKPKCSDF